MSLEGVHHCLDHLIGPPSKIRKLICEIFNKRNVVTTNLLDNANLSHHADPTCTYWLETGYHYSSL